jgi:hypothetical protein
MAAAAHGRVAAPHIRRRSAPRVSRRDPADRRGARVRPGRLSNTRASLHDGLVLGPQEMTGQGIRASIIAGATRWPDGRRWPLQSLLPGDTSCGRTIVTSRPIVKAGPHRSSIGSSARSLLRPDRCPIEPDHRTAAAWGSGICPPRCGTIGSDGMCGPGVHPAPTRLQWRHRLHACQVNATRMARVRRVDGGQWPRGSFVAVVRRLARRRLAGAPPPAVAIGRRPGCCSASCRERRRRTRTRRRARRQPDVEGAPQQWRGS